jgi:PhnB protein
MKDIVACLSFDGNCRQAMNFYNKCLGGDLYTMTYGDMPQAMPNVHIDASNKERILHASITNGSASLIGSDSLPGMPSSEGAEFSICVVPENEEETRRLWAAFSQNATSVKHKLEDVPWGALYGMLTDQFGIQWMFNFGRPKK